VLFRDIFEGSIIIISICSVLYTLYFRIIFAAEPFPGSFQSIPPGLARYWRVVELGIRVIRVAGIWNVLLWYGGQIDNRVADTVGATECHDNASSRRAGVVEGDVAAGIGEEGSSVPGLLSSVSAKPFLH